MIAIRRIPVLLTLCCAHAAAEPFPNLIVNGDFTDGLSGWTVFQSDPANTTAAHDATTGSPSAGSFSFSAQPGAVIYAYQCFDMAAPLKVAFAGRGYTDVAGGLNSFLVSAFSQPGCPADTFIRFVFFPMSLPQRATWSGIDDYALDADLPDGTRSVIVQIGLNNESNPPLAVHSHADHVRFGPSDTLFADGFDPAPGP